MSTSWERANTDWLHDAKFGAMIHYLADTASNREAVDLSIDEWNRRVDSVNIERLVRSLSDTGIRYCILTLGQNSGFYCSPNRTYDDIVGRPSRLSNRDLLADFAASAAKHGIRTIAYLPSHAPGLHPEAVQALKFTPDWDFSSTGIIPGTYMHTEDVDDRLSQGLRNWEAVITEWSTRWGDLVSGWWFDGCYCADKLYRHPDSPNFESFALSAKSGNPGSLVAFNPGVKDPVESMTEFEDYTAGEVNDVRVPARPHAVGRYVNGAQLHILSFLGEYWGAGRVRMPVDQATGFSHYVAQLGGAMTWDVPITHHGMIGDEFLAVLARIGASVETNVTFVASSSH